MKVTAKYILKDGLKERAILTTCNLIESAKHVLANRSNKEDLSDTDTSIMAICVKHETEIEVYGESYTVKTFPNEDLELLGIAVNEYYENIYFDHLGTVYPFIVHNDEDMKKITRQMTSGSLQESIEKAFEDMNVKVWNGITEIKRLFSPEPYGILCFKVSESIGLKPSHISAYLLNVKIAR